MGSIAYGRDSASYSAFGLQFASVGKSGEEIKTVIEEYYGLDGVKYKDYTSQVGLQGYIYQTLSRILCTGRGVSSLLSAHGAYGCVRRAYGGVRNGDSVPCGQKV